MNLLDLTLTSPGDNLALDEALLDGAEAGQIGEVLRFWEPADYFVVLGYANKVETEVNRPACERLGIPILRRCSGGGTVLQGPGCLNYALVLSIDRHREFQTIPQTNDFIMQRHAAALCTLLGKNVTVRGHTDLAVGDLKISGNAQKRKRRFVLFHGTFLMNFEIERIEQTLRRPSKEPGYRKGRSHREFLANVASSREEVKSILKELWGALTRLDRVPNLGKIGSKYRMDDWNLKF